MDWSERILPGPLSDKKPWLLEAETLGYPPHLPTLVIDFDKTICKLEFDRLNGWQVRKRPGADDFLKEMAHYYEIIVYSDDAFPVAQDVIVKWGVQVRSTDMIFYIHGR